MHLKIIKNEIKWKDEGKMENIVEIKNLTKEYKDLKAIDNLSLEVRKGEILGLLRTKWKWKIHDN